MTWLFEVPKGSGSIYAGQIFLKFLNFQLIVLIYIYIMLFSWNCYSFTLLYFDIYYLYSLSRKTTAINLVSIIHVSPCKREI